MNTRILVFETDIETKRRKAAKALSLATITVDGFDYILRTELLTIPGDLSAAPKSFWISLLLFERTLTCVLMLMYAFSLTFPPPTLSLLFIDEIHR